MSYRHLFFDLDHTIWDFENNSREVLRLLYADFKLASCGIECFEAFCDRYEFHNERFWVRFRNGFMTREELRWKRMWHTLLDFKNGDQALAVQLSKVYLDLLPLQSGLMPYAQEILNYCVEKNYKLHLITNGFESAQWQKMRSSGIDHYFSNVVTSENSHSMKPKAEIFNFAIKAASAEIKESIMIGDALEADVLGAQKFGMDQVYFNFWKKSHTESPTFEIHCLSQLKEII